MKQFIRLHSFEDNTIVLFNTQDITGVETGIDDTKFYSLIYIKGVDDSFSANETPEKIYKMLSETKSVNVLKLHDKEDNGVIVLNIEDIVAILTVTDDGKSYAKIYTNTFEDGFVVNETPDKIYSLLNEMKK